MIPLFFDDYLVVIGTIWSLISGAIAWVIKGHVDAGKHIAVIAHADAMRIEERREELASLAQLNRDYTALQTQHRALIVHTDNLAARIADDDEEIGKLRAMIADPLADKLADALHGSELELERCVQERDALQLKLDEAMQPELDEAVYFVVPGAQEKIGGAKPKRPRATKIKAAE